MHERGKTHYKACLFFSLFSQLSLENKRLKDELLDLRVNRGSILEEDLVLESIEASFRQFHSFLDLLRDAG